VVNEHANRLFSDVDILEYLEKFDCDSYYDEKTGEGSLTGLVGLVYEVFNLLNGGENDR